MCGICGQYNFGSGRPVIRQDIELMARSIAHRGPDDEGYYIHGAVGLGFRRLSIIDLSGGHQPMSDQDELVWVVFNGEIYNFPELRSELEGLGHKFRTRSDTEVIVHGYKQWGDDVLNHLNGMFGLAVWDVRKRRLLLARDPFGIKLIYYTVEGGHLYFGSEIRAVLAGTGDRPDVDPDCLNLFLRYRYTPSPHTLYRGIQKLAPGSKLVCENDTCRVSSWYKKRPKLSLPHSDREAIEQLAELYTKAMKRHLLSDVPVGLLLSGGVDSGLLLALMNLYGKDWQTYSVGYGESFADDELRDAESTARSFSSRHTAVVLDRDRFEYALPSIVACLEEPIASSSIVPMYFVCQRARQDVKVALIGQGPDELFAGYRRHVGVRYAAYWSSLPDWAKSPVVAAIGALPRNETLKRGAYSLGIEDRARRYEKVLSLLPGDQIDGLFVEGILHDNAADRLLDCWKDIVPLMSETDELGGFQLVELRSTLPDELLMFGDKLSMAHGLEVRVPYLDRELVEYAESLPARFKVRGFSQKWLHRQVCRRFLPVEILKRKKRGFAVNVVDQWFRGAIKSQLSEIILDPQSQMYRFLKPSAVQSLYMQHRAGHHDHHKILFSLVAFEEWLRIHLSPGILTAA